MFEKHHSYFVVEACMTIFVFLIKLPFLENIYNSDILLWDFITGRQTYRRKA